MAFNYGQRPETIKIVTNTQDDDPKVMRNFIRPINCVATGDTIVWEDAGEQTTTFKVLKMMREVEKDVHDSGFRQRVFSKHVTIFDLEADNPEMPHCVAKVTYDNFMEKETIEILPISMIEENKKGKRSVKEMAHTMTRGEPIMTTDAIYAHWKETFGKAVSKTFPEFQKTTAYGRDSFIAPGGWFVVFREGYNSGYSMLIISKNGRTLEMWEGLDEDDFQEDLADLLSVTYQYVKDYTVKESHLKTKHIKESIIEDGIASFLKWLREENFITPIEERDFMKYLKRGEIEEQDVDIIYDIGTDYDPEHESNENFEKCANIVKSYVGPWTDPAYESRKRSKKGIKEMARVNDFDLSPYDLRNQIKSYVRGRLYDLVGPEGANYLKINQPKWDMMYDGAQGGTCFAIKTQGEDYYISTFVNSSIKWRGKGFEEFKEDFEDMVQESFNK